MQKKFLNIVFCLLCLPLVSLGQENYNILKDGIQNMQAENYADAEANFRKVIENNDTIKEAYFNLGNAVLKQGRFEEARENYEKALSFSTQKQDKAETYHNIGNSYMQEEEWEKSIDAYKNALKNNSKDMDTKYNLAYALEKLKKEQEQQQENQDQEQEKDQDKEENKDGEKQEDKKDKGDKEEQSEEEKSEEEKQDGEKEEEEKDGKGDDEKEEKEPKEEEKNGKPQEMKLSKEEAERLLRAIENEEQKLQDKKKQDEMDPVRIETEKDW